MNRRGMAAQAEPDGEGAILRAKIALVRPALAMASGRLWAGADTAGYRRYLAAMYPLNRATVAVLRAARARCLRRPGDPLSRALVVFLTRHIAEERRHDRWVADGLAALGSPAAADALSVASLASMVGAQYYLIEAVHPVAVLGYMAVLQSDPPSPALLGHLRALTGDTAAVSALSHHAEQGEAPLAATYALLDQMALGERLRAGVGLSALHTAAAAITLFGELASPPGTVAAGLASGPAVLIADQASQDAMALSAAERAVLGAINRAVTDLADVFAHGADVVGGLFL